MAMQPWKRFWRGLLGLAGRPARHAQGRRGAGRGGVVIQAYRGYGDARAVFLIGRVFRQSGRPRDRTRVMRDLRDIGRRITRRAVADACLTARFCGGEARVRTDADGYFRIHLTPAETPPDDRLWHSVDLSLSEPEAVEARAEVFIPPRSARTVVVSDIDDTILFTGVANKLAMLWRLFVHSAEDREAFPGVAKLYAALHEGADGRACNPILYVSRGPWGIYDVLDTFFQAHRIPVGPILFLREWGVSWRSPLPRKAVDHKAELIARMLALYQDMPFVLIGDSGQHDPEVYRRVVEDNPGRIRAIYIRDVSRKLGRKREIEAMAENADANGVSLVLADDSAAMAEHAASIGLIDPAAVEGVRQAQDGPGGREAASAGSGAGGERSASASSSASSSSTGSG